MSLSRYFSLFDLLFGATSTPNTFEILTPLQLWHVCPWSHAALVWKCFAIPPSRSFLFLIFLCFFPIEMNGEIISQGNKGEKTHRQTSSGLMSLDNTEQKQQAFIHWLHQIRMNYFRESGNGSRRPNTYLYISYWSFFVLTFSLCKHKLLPP